VEIGGRTLGQGQRVFAFLNAANRDPEQFDDADRFDVGRNPNAHLTFGHGIHFCLGAPLARLEGQIALKRLLDRYPDIRLQDGLVPHWHDSLIMRGITAMPILLR
ncbi:cytochrome P450, partial [Leclercia adecarboxylata]|uniref:cytochrome P450 n=1 Tax=Leclercia adecarboxylata TaxID=83655 RepID=UPI00234D3AE1